MGLYAAPKHGNQFWCVADDQLPLLLLQQRAQLIIDLLLLPELSIVLLQRVGKKVNYFKQRHVSSSGIKIPNLHIDLVKIQKWSRKVK